MGSDAGCILAIDQGTTNTKVLLIDRAGSVVAHASRPLKQTYPKPAWVEQDPIEIWDSVRAAIDDCLAQAGTPRLEAIAISNQRESVTAWDRRTGQPLGPVIVWQCRRTASFCEELRARGLQSLLEERTGLTIDPLFSASKMRWLLDRIEDGKGRAERGEICLGTMDSWVLWNLTGGAAYATDMTNASRTQLLDIHRLERSRDLLDIFGVPREALAGIKPSSAIYGATVSIGRLPAGVPVASMIGDSHAALFGQAGFLPGSVKATYGTGSSLMTPVASPVASKHGLSTTVAWSLGLGRVTFALEGNISFTGAAIQWLGEMLSLPNESQGVADLAKQVDDAEGVYMVPAFAGLGAPYWDEAARGLITGITRSTRAAHIARAAVESVAYQVRDVFDIMRTEAGYDLQVLLADGGATRNEMLMQFQADMIGLPVLRNLSTDVSALGAAYLAGLAMGMWSSVDEIEQLRRSRDRFEPSMPASERDRLYDGWVRAVARATYDTSPA
ncbi:MAG: glycerol kinase GlpK [Chloroflexota bacterium]